MAGQSVTHNRKAAADTALALLRQEIPDYDAKVNAAKVERVEPASKVGAPKENQSAKKEKKNNVDNVNIVSSKTKGGNQADAWPRSARGLGDALRRQRPALAQIGIGIEFGRTSRGITVTIRRLPAEPVHVVHVVHVDPLSTLPARGVPQVADALLSHHICKICQHLDGNHCRSRNEFIEHPSVGSCKRWEARGRIVNGVPS